MEKKKVPLYLCPGGVFIVDRKAKLTKRFESA